eukprot:GHRQ01015809.1.p1 GENE.GHRQ01015809.1~~GHRQ01015809.1.p1  ORF type:complete len:205 (-),score=52.99 GHRQ01015809.1:155-769(-)
MCCLCQVAMTHVLPLLPACSYSYMGREANLSYLARTKVKGVPHHAKAGNINSALLKECEGSGTFVLVLDCDMIVHPDFLQNILGHFYKQVRDLPAIMQATTTVCCPNACTVQLQEVGAGGCSRSERPGAGQLCSRATGVVLQATAITLAARLRSGIFISVVKQGQPRACNTAVNCQQQAGQMGLGCSFGLQLVLWRYLMVYLQP